MPKQAKASRDQPLDLSSSRWRLVPNAALPCTSNLGGLSAPASSAKSQHNTFQYRALSHVVRGSSLVRPSVNAPGIPLSIRPLTACQLWVDSSCHIKYSPTLAYSHTWTTSAEIRIDRTPGRHAHPVRSYGVTRCIKYPAHASIPETAGQLTKWSLIIFPNTITMFSANFRTSRGNCRSADQRLPPAIQGSRRMGKM